MTGVAFDFDALFAPPGRDALIAEALEVATSTLSIEADEDDFARELAERYRFDPIGYIREKLGWEPWSGTTDAPGQVEIIEAYLLALRQQHERLAWEQGELRTDELQYWRPGEVVPNRLHVPAGHTVGKTKLASGLVNHFYDCFVPSLVYTFAPSWEQIHDLLWKEIKTDRRDKGLPGRILDLELKRADNHFAKGRATDNSGNRGTERVQGQHGRYLMYVIDEAEGVPDFKFDAIDSMSSGGLVIVLMLANPRTRSSRFHKQKALPDVRSFRISCLAHPNVVQGREVVPGAVRRDYVEKMVATHCEVVDQHDDDEQTFTLPFPVRGMEGQVYEPGTIFLPDPEMMFRVLGVAPANIADNTFVPIGRYEAAKARQPKEDRPHLARLGIDVARYGKDVGTVWVRWNGRAWRAARLAQLDTNAYARAAKKVALELLKRGVENLHIRVDGGGGYGGGVIDKVKVDLELRRAFKVFRVLEVHFGGTPHEQDAYADLATEMYAHAAETLKGIALEKPPDALEADLCERPFGWLNHRGKDVKQLQPKEKFKKEFGRSPDDGDGLALATAPDFIFARRHAPIPPSTSYVTV